MKIQELARDYALKLHVRRATDGTAIIVADDDPGLNDLIWDAHGDLLPDNYIYEFVLDALRLIASTPDLSAPPALKGDSYPHNLLQWLCSHIERAAYVDQAIQAAGRDTLAAEGRLFALLRDAQRREREAVYQSVFASLHRIVR